MEDIILTLIKNTLEECFIFHSNLDLNVSLSSYPEFYINIFHSCKNTLDFLSLTPSCLRSQFLWFNKDVQINFIFEHLCRPSGVFKS